MSKLENLSQIFSKGHVVIFCCDKDQNALFKELDDYTNTQECGVYKNDSPNPFDTRSVFTNGRTFHFIEEKQLNVVLEIIGKTQD